MAFPTTIYSQTNPSASDTLNNPSHSGQHIATNNDLVAIEQKLGLGAGTPTSGAMLYGTGNGTSSWGTAGTVPFSSLQASYPGATIRSHTGGTIARLIDNGTATSWVNMYGSNINIPSVTADGTAPDVDFGFQAKGTGKLKDLSARFQSASTYSATPGGTVTLTLNTSNEHRITMGAGNSTLAVSNAVDGQKFIVSITQDSVGTRTVTWFSTIRWAGSAAPTLTTTANKRDTFGFIATGTATFDGFIVGQNI